MPLAPTLVAVEGVKGYRMPGGMAVANGEGKNVPKAAGSIPDQRFVSTIEPV